MRFYNTAGPVKKEDHYCIDPLARIDLDAVLLLISQKKYFAIHAPRQTGKTSVFLALADHLNSLGTYCALYFNIESVLIAQGNLIENTRSILSELASRARDYLDDPYPESIVTRVLEDKGPHLAFNEMLTLWSKNSGKPIVLFIDEIDSLDGDLLVSILRQLRSGFDKRPRFFPQSIVFCGVQNLQFKKIEDPVQGTIMAGNIFNIEATSIELSNLRKEEIESLFRQYTDDKGIRIEADIFDRVWALTKGQPWLVNALANEICFKMIPGKNDIDTIRLREVEEAAENLIQRKEMHLNNLVGRLKEPGVKKILQPMLNGDDLPQNVTEEEVRYLCDLGIVRIIDKEISIANGIYNETIPRSLIYQTQLLIRYNLSLFLDADGRLDIKKMLKGFHALFNAHYEKWVEHFDYREAGKPLLLQAFLQRILDGGGRIERFYGIGRKHITLVILWPYAGDYQKEVVDIRFIPVHNKDTIKDDIRSTVALLGEFETDHGFLVCFYRGESEFQDQKMYTVTSGNLTINVLII